MLRVHAASPTALPGAWGSTRAILAGALVALFAGPGVWGLLSIELDTPMLVGWAIFVLGGFGAGIVSMKLSYYAPRRHALGLIAVILAVGWTTDWVLSATDPLGGWNEIACAIGLGVVSAILAATILPHLRPSP